MQFEVFQQFSISIGNILFFSALSLPLSRFVLSPLLTQMVMLSLRRIKVRSKHEPNFTARNWHNYGFHQLKV